MSRKVFFAIQLWGNENILSLFSEIERLGYDGAYYGDGPFNWLSDCFSILAASSLITHTMRIGPVVTYLDGSYRSLVATIKALVTISNLSKGRLDARFGFIKEDARPYWKEFGIVIPNLKERIERVEEGLFISKQIFTKGGINFEGKYHRLNISEFTPKPLFSIPVWIAAMGKKTIKIALKYADVWEVSFIPPEHLARLIEEHRTLISRRNVEISLEADVIIGKDRREFEKSSLDIWLLEV